MAEESLNLGSNFIRDLIKSDTAAGKHGGRVETRFPPEPNGYLHIGHVKAICLDFGMAKEFGGVCHLRMDDTNPTKENMEYVESIQRDIHWLGFDWGEHLYFASDYFEKMYEYAVVLIKKGLAYVCDLSPEAWEEYRGDLTHPGKESPGRKRSVEENLDLFARMRAGEFPDGAMVLRAKIDMNSPNITMRDPVIYRIRRVHHFRQGDKWCIYPMYDFAHPLEDAIEHITHSLCTLEFEIHRPFYDWLMQALEWPDAPVQTEFSRLNITYTVMSKRKLLELVRDKHVAGWDDPRMPTVSGMRRRGIPAAAIRNFCELVGVTKFNATTDAAFFDHCVREELNKEASRYMAVLDPLKVTIENYPEEQIDELDAVNNPEKPEAGSRKVPFSREIYIERADFMEEPVKGYFRLAPGREVRLRYAYFITCTGVDKDADGNIIGLRATYDPATRGGDAPDGRKVKGTIHWVAAKTALPMTVRLYDRLFTVEEPGAGDTDYLTQLNPDSLKEVKGFMEPELGKLEVGTTVQFERQGYFAKDPDSTADCAVFNRTVALKDSWAKKNK